MKDYEIRIMVDSDAMLQVNKESKHPCFEGVDETKATQIWHYAYLMGAIGATCSPAMRDDVLEYIHAMGGVERKADKVGDKAKENKKGCRVGEPVKSCVTAVKGIAVDDFRNGDKKITDFYILAEVEAAKDYARKYC